MARNKLLGRGDGLIWRVEVEAVGWLISRKSTENIVSRDTFPFYLTLTSLIGTTTTYPNSNRQLINLQYKHILNSDLLFRMYTVGPQVCF